MQAEKRNKVYTITEQEKDRYLKEGFNIIKDDGTIEQSPVTKISIAKHAEVTAEKDAVIEKLEKKIKEQEKVIKAQEKELVALKKEDIPKNEEVPEKDSKKGT
jgi:iron uptake system EfeUOB component EfeO/EfeM